MDTEIKSEYSGYIHTNGTVNVKRCVFGEDLIDKSSPFLKKHLGRIEAETIMEAVDKFKEIAKGEEE